MRRQNITLFALLISIATTACAVSPFIYYRSQSVDAARDLVGITQYINRYNNKDLYCIFSFTPEYTHSCNAHDIAQCLFGKEYTNGCSGATIHVSGSHVAQRGQHDWLADYFYLPTDYQSTLHFKPEISNAMADFSFYIGLDELLPGLYFHIHTPFAWQRTTLNMCETHITGSATHDAGYFAQVAIPATNLLHNVTEFGRGTSPDNVVTTSGTTYFTALKYARFDRCTHSRAGLSDIQAVLGWNWMPCEKYHIGAGVRVAAPTGSRISGIHLLEPVIGNGKHWEIGGQITAHARIWRDDCANNSLNAYVTANLTHLCSSNQFRTFDLKNKPLSRYMLALDMGQPVDNKLVGQNPGDATPTAPNYFFFNTLSPVANFSTLNVGVSIALQADVAAQLTYIHKGFTLDLGYDFWGHTAEKLRSSCIGSCSLATFPENSWALKGDEYVFGFAAATDAGTPSLFVQNYPIGLSATENRATIHAGTNFPEQGTNDPAVIAQSRNNPGIDNPAIAFAGTAQTAVLSIPNGATPINQTRTSVQPIMLTADDIDVAGTKGHSQKVYLHGSYGWINCPRWTPFIGVGGFAEFGSHGSKASQLCSSSCVTSCNNCAISQWGVWTKGGISF
jgi:hypothetical protein